MSIPNSMSFNSVTLVDTCAILCYNMVRDKLILGRATMKKHLKLISMLLVIALSTLTLSSCSILPLEMIGEAALAVTLEDRAEKKLSSLSSYTASSEMTLSTVVSGVTINYTMSGKDMVSGARTADAEYSSEYSYVTRMSGEKGTGSIQRTYLKQGLYKGEGYINTRVGNEFRLMVKSPLTEAEYLEFLKNDTDGGGHALCGKANAKKREDGGWSASFTDFDAASLGALAEYYGLTNISADLKIVDATYSFEVDKSLVYESAELTFEFSDAKSSFTIKTNYSDIGSTVCTNPGINDYEQVSDIRLPNKVRTDIRNYIKEKSGSFIIDISAVRDDQEYGGLDREGTFGWTDDGKFVCRVKLVNGFYEEYANGVVTETHDKTRELTEASATMYISSLLNPIGFNEMSIDTFKVNTDGTICFDIILPNNFFYNATGGRYRSEKEATMLVSYEDGKLSSVVVEANRVGVNNGYTNKMRLTITYGK